MPQRAPAFVPRNAAAPLPTAPNGARAANPQQAPQQALLHEWAERAASLATQAAQAAWPAEAGPVRVQVVPGTLDPRLQLAPCQEAALFLPTGHRAWGRTRVGLRCVQGPVKWSVTMPFQVQVWAQALVLAQPLQAGTTLNDAHLAVAEVDWAAADSPVITQPAAVRGRQLGVALAAGVALREQHLRDRQWFAAGDEVRLLARGDGFSVQATGVALTPGFEGQPVRVKMEGGRVVQGRAIGARQVAVGP